MPSKLDPYKPLSDRWLAAEPRLRATRIHQHLVRDYGFDGGYNRCALCRAGAAAA